MFFIVLACVVSPRAWAFARPDKEYKVFQFPRTAIQRIDGDFSDWEKVPASEMTVATVPDDAYYKAGKVAKVYAGETYVNFYVEYEDSAEQPVQIMHLYLDSDMAFDGEGRPTTGMGNAAWTNDGADILFEGMVVDDAGAPADRKSVV